MAATDSKKCLLIVDDEDDMGMILESVCSSVAEEIYYAENGKKALEMLERHPVNVVLSDMMMPEMNGLDLLREMRARGRTIPFVLMSGMADEHAVGEVLLLGAFDYVEKPFEMDDLLGIIRSAFKTGEIGKTSAPISVEKTRQEILNLSIYLVQSLTSDLRSQAFHMMNHVAEARRLLNHLKILAGVLDEVGLADMSELILKLYDRASRTPKLLQDHQAIVRQALMALGWRVDQTLGDPARTVPVEQINRTIAHLHKILQQMNQAA